MEAPTLWDVDFKTAVAQAEMEEQPGRGQMPGVRDFISDPGVFANICDR